jgi:hypothetical protein
MHRMLNIYLANSAVAEQRRINRRRQSGRRRTQPRRRRPV